MKKTFILEAVMLAVYGELLAPPEPVEYMIPLSTIYELEEILHSPEPIMLDREEDQHVRTIISQMISYFSDPFARKKLQKGLVAPWSTVSFPYHNEVTLTVLKAEDTAYWGDTFDPVETELLLSAMRWEVPLLTDQIDLQSRMIVQQVPVQFYDIDDFTFAVEEGISLEDLRG
ncbi:ADP-heptose synthase [Brevibacillus humidisoli]|uniref:ADP-heptose synthase n=1 Tax=Brevibacillus humidisoli TaxID=2895522 RepID=UPI001E4FFD16|nr:ADP-heptose synthase [Brevibacillus humidisoli]UFJ41687.1 ADP-heptose synthase [Brevibacillus humidisoli]